MTIKQTNDALKQIAELMELSPCKTPSSINMNRNVQGFLHNNMEYPISELRYRSSFDWQISAWSKLGHLVQELAIKKPKCEERYFSLLDKYNMAVFNNDVTKGFEVLVLCLEWYNKNK